MSLWLDGASRSYPSLEHDTAADVAIVGGGIAGVATAYFLAKAGARVIVLEARGIAEGASGRNAGFLLAGVAENFVAASRRYGETNAWRIWRVTKRTHQIVRSLTAEHAISCELRWNGSDQIAGDDGEWSEIAESARRLAARGIATSVDATHRSATYAGDGDLHPVKWVRGLARHRGRARGRRGRDADRGDPVASRCVPTRALDRCRGDTSLGRDDGLLARRAALRRTHRRSAVRVRRIHRTRNGVRSGVR